MQTKSIPELSVDTQILVKHLQTIQVGDVATYTDLSKLIGRNVADGANYILQSAQRILERAPYRIIFGTVRGQGVRRLDDIGTVSKGKKRSEHVRRQNKRIIRELSAVQNFDSLPSDTKVTHHLTLSLARINIELEKPSVSKKLEGFVTQTMPSTKLLESAIEALKK